MKKTVIVETYVEVEVDESKFTEEFMKEFRDYLYPFKTIDDHIKFLAELKAGGLITTDFIEGYGESRNFGIKMEIDGIETDILYYE